MEFGEFRSLVHREKESHPGSNFNQILQTLFVLHEDKFLPWWTYAHDQIMRTWSQTDRTVTLPFWYHFLTTQPDCKTRNVKQLFEQHQKRLTKIWQLATIVDVGHLSVEALSPILSQLKLYQLKLGDTDLSTHSLPDLTNIGHVIIHFQFVNKDEVQAIFDKIVDTFYQQNHTLHSISLKGHSGYLLRRRSINRLINSPTAHQLSKLSLTSMNINILHIQTLLNAEHLFNLKVLNLNKNQLMDRDIPTLLASPMLGQIEQLSLGSNPFSQSGRLQLKARFGDNLIIEQGY